MRRVTLLNVVRAGKVLPVILLRDRQDPGALTHWTGIAKCREDRVPDKRTPVLDPCHLSLTLHRP